MRKYVLVSFCLCLLMFTGGCASKHMQTVAPETQTTALAEGESALVFLRYSSLGGAIQAPVVVIVNGKPEFVGILSAGTKLRYKTIAGKSSFVLGGESSHLLEAELDGGKTYYVYVEPRMGFAKARFEFVPISVSEQFSDKLQKRFSRSDWVVSGPSAQQWFNDNRESLAEKYTAARAKEDKAIIMPAQGFTRPLQ